MKAADVLRRDRIPTGAALGGLAAAVVAAAAAASLSPGLTLVGIVALGVAALLSWRIDLALAAVVATAPLEGVAAAGSEGLLTPPKLAGAAMVAAFALQLARRRVALRLDATHWMVGGLLWISMVSALLARDPATGLLVASRYASFALFYVIASQFAGDLRLVRRLLWALSAAACTAGVLSLYNYLTGTVAYRASLEYADPNDVAFVLATTLPMTLALMTGSRPAAARAGAALLALGVAAAIPFTLSRGALVGLAAGVLWWVLVERRNRAHVLLGLVTVALIGVLVATADPARFEEAVAAKEKVAAANVEARFDAWGAALQLATTHPLGVGPGNFRLYYPEVSGSPAGMGPVVVHNTYLDIAAELGIVAALLFCVYLWACARRLGRAGAAGGPGAELVPAVRTSLVVAVVAGLFLSQQYYLPFWLLGALAAILAADRGASAG